MSTDAMDAAFLKRLTVLYVEDDLSARDEISAFLRRRVGALVTAANGAEGLAAFQSQDIQMVVTDIQMPVMDGLAMAAAIRGLNPAVPILVTTAFEQTNYLLRSIEIGIDHYVVKPVRAQPLEAALLTCARRLRAEDEMKQKRQLEAEVQQLRHQAAINTLLGGIAHDYNNLLQAILASMDAAAACLEPGSRALHFLEGSKAASEQARQLSRRLLSLANPAHALKPAEPLEALLRSTAVSALVGSPVTVAFAFQAGDPPVRHDATALTLVVENLVVNAAEAMPEGGTLHISTCVESQGEQGPVLHLAFRDEGKGIAPDHLPMVFEPYFTTKARGSQRGTGLGLAVSQAIVRAHGGSIWAESRPGEGATFHIHLPMEPGQSDPG
jgi:signal transduction histidine kinase